MSRSTTRILGWIIPVLLVGFWLRVSNLTAAPPGLHFDEAANAIIIENIVWDAYRPVFIPDFTGKEVLWFYITALLTRFAGSSIFVLRYASVLAGILTIAVGGWAVGRLYRRAHYRSELMVLTAAVISVALWHSILSRLAFRAITQPLLQALTVGLLWAALSTNKKRSALSYAAAAGAAFSLTGYTYLAARLFPLMIALALVVWLLSQRFSRLALACTGIFSLTAISVFAPLGLYFLRQPEAFSTRIEQVGPASSTAALEGWRLASRMLFFSGDPLWRFNVPFAPLFDPVLATLCVIGFGLVAQSAFRKQAQPDERARDIMLLLWPVVMLAPTALAVGSITPSNLRAVGLLPLIALYPAVAIVFVFKRRYVAQSMWVSMLILVAGGVFTALRLSVWAASSELYYQNDTHVALLGKALSAGTSDFPIYAATEHLDHPTLRYLSRPIEPISMFRGEAAVFPEVESVRLAYVRNALPPKQWQDMWQPYLVEEITGPDGGVDYLIYELPEDIDLGLQADVEANIANLLILEGVQFYPTVAGEAAEVDLLWRITGTADQPDYSFTAQLCDVGGWCWLKTNGTGAVERGVNASFPSDRWQVDDHLLIRLSVPLPDGIPPGDYTLRISVFSASSGAALPAIDAQGRAVTPFAEVVGVTVTPNTAPDVASVPIQFKQPTAITDDIRLLGWDLPVDTVRQGESMDLALHWFSLTENNVEQPVQIFVGDQIIIERNPVYGTYPAEQWAEGEMITDRYRFQIPVDAETGAQRLRVRLGDSPPRTIATIDVQAVSRLFEVPTAATLLEKPVIFDDRISLLGFVNPTETMTLEAGDVIPVEPVWQAETTVREDYTVFVHLLDANGQLVAQVDRTPIVDGQSYPTSLWVAGEIIQEDPLMLTVPTQAKAGQYQLTTGLYLPKTGQRLQTSDTQSDSYILPFDFTIN